MDDIKKEARFNLFGEFDFTGQSQTWAVENGSLVRKEAAEASELDTRTALQEGGAWAYKEGDNVYIDTGDTMLHQATIVERRANLKYGITCQGSPIVHEIDEADIIDVNEKLFE